MARRRTILAVMTCGVVLLVLAFWPQNHPFSKLVLSPVPASVSVTFYESNDWLGLNPEPVCYLAFEASTTDLAQVISRGGFTEVATNTHIPGVGPTGIWQSFDACGVGRRLFTRDHPSRPGVPIGRRRSWSEFLWIDGTGTNAYFLIWGI